MEPTVLPEASALPVTDTIAPTPLSITPIVIAPLLEFVEWSPDSQWLVYRTFNEDEKAEMYIIMQGFADTPGTVYFFNTQNSQTCPYPHPVAREAYRSSIAWLSDGKVLVREYDGTIRAGTPCTDDFAAVDDVAEISNLFFDPDVSPQGNYRVITSVVERTDEPSGGVMLSLVTTIENLNTGEIENTFEWQRWEEFGLGSVGEWIRDDLFLIYHTFDKGPLLVQVGQSVVEIVPELFMQSLHVTCDEEPCEVALWSEASSDVDTNNYHILLYGAGVVGNYPRLWLYHSEDGQIEELPLREMWWPGFSPDGAWLLLKELDEQDSIWIRPVEAVGEDVWQFPPSGFNVQALSDTGEKMVFGIQNLGSENLVSVFTFPEGVETGSWSIEHYTPHFIRWAPNGNFVVIHGSLGEPEKALFFISIP
ncbi:MAG TPA: hypothetical protein VMN57_10730 [Anaerolineales bacterium]|nr:hypothetical protein [Anaerolineales bacterium]